MASLYRADQAGSLLRPPGSLQARDEYKEKRRSLEELRRMEDQAILEALAMQRQTGVDVFTEGEYDGSTSSVG
jgi:5-methyltetrahydropteroyltriglutamate--homocysteine methyltransferase